jgi:hypothetical protein
MTRFAENGRTCCRGHKGGDGATRPSGLSRPYPICYMGLMTSRSASKGRRRRTTMVPVTTMEEIPVLSDTERAQLSNSLKEAQARLKAGKGIDYDPKTFKDRLIGIYRGGKR